MNTRHCARPTTGCCFFLLIALLPASAAYGTEAVLTRKPYLQMGTPDSIVIVWRTQGPSTPVVRWGRSTGDLQTAVDHSKVVTRVSPDHEGDIDLPRLSTAPANTFQYEARITGLSPATTYYYGVHDAQRQLSGGDETHHFATSPPAGQARPLRFWVVGDSGTGESDQARVHAAMIHYTTQSAHPLDLYLHVGDMVYPKGEDHHFQQRFFDVYEPTLRNTICWASMGNHEGATSKGLTGIGPYYDAYVLPAKAEAGGLASGTEAFYAVDYGRVHFICLDSHDLDRRPSGAMAKWLKADLEKTKADWLIAFWHHPPYSKGSHDSDTDSQMTEMRKHIMPILESAGVDLVLTGHSHIYERSMLMNRAYATPTVAENVILDDGDGNPEGDGAYRKSAGLNPNEGTIQIVAGHGGAGLGRKGTMPVMKKVIVEHGSVIVDINDDTLTAVMVDKNRETRDLFSIVKQGQVTPKPIDHPKQLPAYTPPPKAKR
ncbi:MAG: metallophosphoesterase family protein [Planctomycetia bacterium]|nr:metallophosphoesterase family protein [Planctomycetia bacterium]